MTAGDDAVQADCQDPGHHDEREELHHRLSCRIRSVCSSSSLMIRMNAAATSTPDEEADQRDGPGRTHRAGAVPRGRKFARYGQAHGHRGDANGGEAARPDRLDRVGDVDRADPPEDQELPGQVDEDERGGQHHAALEAARRAGLGVRGEVPPEDHDGPGEQQAARRTASVVAGTRRSSGLVPGGALPLAAQRGAAPWLTPAGGDEENELLAHRVEAAVLEVHRRHHAGGIGLRHRDRG